MNWKNSPGDGVRADTTARPAGKGAIIHNDASIARLLMSPSESHHSQDAGAPNAASSDPARGTGGWRRFGLRELFLLVLAAALAVGWYSSSRRTGDAMSTRPEPVRRIEGPLVVDYSVQWSENTVVNHNNVSATSLDFHEQYVIVTTTHGRSDLIPVASLRSFRWRPAPEGPGEAPSMTKRSSH